MVRAGAESVEPFPPIHALEVQNDENQSEKRLDCGGHLAFDRPRMERESRG
jgi:hypothetical protein